MNKSEKIICLLLGVALGWYIFSQKTDEAKALATKGSVPATSVQQASVQQLKQESSASLSEVTNSSAKKEEAQKKFLKPEEIISLENNILKLEISNRGAAVKKAILKKYPKNVGELSDENKPVEFDFSASPLGSIVDNEKLSNIEFAVSGTSSNSVTFTSGIISRKIELRDNYQLAISDRFHDEKTGPYSLSIGSMRMGDSKNDLLSIDSFDNANDEVIHHCEGDSPLKSYLVGGLSGGCSGSKSAKGMPQFAIVPYTGFQKYVALKNRFFVTAFCSSTSANNGFSTRIERDMHYADYRPKAISANVKFEGTPAEVETLFYIGPKKQSILWDLEMKDVMEFGMWRWICYPLVSIINFFYDYIPSFGIAIILLTILVRLIFWPLTHKSTVGMKKMQELQPKLKEIQSKFKDNPQRLQQETWALYRDNKVNPLSSCLPMLIQIPVFIALFNVLRSAVELRYAPFLWIADLSEPEALFASWFPFGGLNILPILMALTTALQSAFTPSTGDRNQQRMMIVFMPVMMLVMFYSFPSALSLYWFLSNLFSIVQMWLIRRKTSVASSAVIPEVIDPPQTRQMRRHG